jgi:alanine racemase
MQELVGRVGARVMVRPGIALYGYCLQLDTGRAGALGKRVKPVLTWKTRVIGLREIGAGTTVGYGATFTAKSLMRLALLPVGYADGLRRAASSGVGDGWVMIGGRRAKVVGRVSMNLVTVDVTDVEGVAVGDEVVLLGEGVTAEDHARWSGTISYEILCGIRAKFVES